MNENEKVEAIAKYQVPEGQKIPDWIINEARLINQALKKEKITEKEAQEGLTEEQEVLGVMRSLMGDMVNVRYFVEYPPEVVRDKDRGEMLGELFNSEFEHEGKNITLADYLVEKGQGVSIAMSSLDDSTAETIRHLNEKGIPVVAWVVVDDIEGYWTNPTNVAETSLKTDQIRSWAEKHHLQLEAVGFDLEKPIGLTRAVTQLNIVEIIKQLRDCRTKIKEIKQAGSTPQRDFETLVANLEQEAVQTEIYAFPAGPKGLIRKLMGGLQVPGKQGRVIEMCYSSFLPEIPLIKERFVSLMKGKDSIPALGIVSGKEGETPGRDLTPGKLPAHLTKEQLARDLSQLRAYFDTGIDLGARTITPRELYLFALNDARVALMLEQAMETAFRREKAKK